VSENGGVKMLLQGNIDMDTVSVLFATGMKHLASNDLHVDFSRVESVDSAAVSMLLGWTRAAQRGHRALHLVAVPDDLLSLARLYGVEDMLPQQSD
jgi:phospholipid transport system transporter-binding protein